MDSLDTDVWNALRDQGHSVGPAHVDDDGVLWVLVDGAPLSTEAARSLLETGKSPMSGDRADVTLQETKAESLDRQGRGPHTLG